MVGNLVFDLQETVFIQEQDIPTPSTAGIRVCHNDGDRETYILFSDIHMPVGNYNILTQEFYSIGLLM
jgi:hypothetical protein